MKREEIIELMKDVYTSSEAAEFLNISCQRLNQLVHDKKIMPIKEFMQENIYNEIPLDEVII